MFWDHLLFPLYFAVRVADEHRFREMRAALQIQCLFRGFRVRKIINNLSYEYIKFAWYLNEVQFYIYIKLFYVDIY